MAYWTKISQYFYECSKCEHLEQGNPKICPKCGNAMNFTFYAREDLAEKLVQENHPELILEQHSNG